MDMNGDMIDSQIIILKNEVEELREELHSVNIKYSSKIALEKDAVEEIEILQRKLEAEKFNERNRVLKVEEEIKQINKIWKQEIENLKAEYEDQAQKDAKRIEQLEKELIQMKDRLKAEAETFIQSKHACEMMSEALKEELEKKEKAEATNKLLKYKLEEIEQKLEEALEIRAMKEEEVESLKEQLTQAEEEVALCSAQIRELQVPKTNNEPMPSDDSSSKGNSLFAEVDDRRQLMKQQLLVEKNKIVNLKRAYKSKSSQVQHLQAQLTDVTRKWNEDAKEAISSQNNLIASLRFRVKELEEAQTIQSPVSDNSREREFVGRTNGEPLDEYKYMEIELEQGREEIKKLKEKLNQVSIGKLLNDEELYKLKSDVRRLKAENAYLLRVVNDHKLSSNRSEKSLEGLLENGES